MERIWTLLWESEIYFIKQLFLTSTSLCVSYVVPTTKVNKVEYKGNKDILMMFQETEEWKFSREAISNVVYSKANYS